jgi:hypothetical protein
LPIRGLAISAVVAAPAADITLRHVWRNSTRSLSQTRMTAMRS